MSRALTRWLEMAEAGEGPRAHREMGRNRGPQCRSPLADTAAVIPSWKPLLHKASPILSALADRECGGLVTPYAARSPPAAETVAEERSEETELPEFRDLYYADSLPQRRTKRSHTLDPTALPSPPPSKGSFRLKSKKNPALRNPGACPAAVAAIRTWEPVAGSGGRGPSRLALSAAQQLPSKTHSGSKFPRRSSSPRTSRPVYAFLSRNYAPLTRCSCSTTTVPGADIASQPCEMQRVPARPASLLTRQWTPPCAARLPSEERGHGFAGRC